MEHLGEKKVSNKAEGLLNVDMSDCKGYLQSASPQKN